MNIYSRFESCRECGSKKIGIGIRNEHSVCHECGLVIANTFTSRYSEDIEPDSYSTHEGLMGSKIGYIPEDANSASHALSRIKWGYRYSEDATLYRTLLLLDNFKSLVDISRSDQSRIAYIFKKMYYAKMNQADEGYLSKNYYSTQLLGVAIIRAIRERDLPITYRNAMKIMKNLGMRVTVKILHKISRDFGICLSGRSVRADKYIPAIITDIFELTQIQIRIRSRYKLKVSDYRSILEQLSRDILKTDAVISMLDTVSIFPKSIAGTAVYFADRIYAESLDISVNHSVLTQRHFDEAGMSQYTIRDQVMKYWKHIYDDLVEEIDMSEYL